jgi:hypothetical protein
MTTYKALTLLNSFTYYVGSSHDYTPPSGRWAKIYVTDYDPDPGFTFQATYPLGGSRIRQWSHDSDTGRAAPTMYIVENGKTIRFQGDAVRIYVEEFPTNEYP